VYTDPPYGIAIVKKNGKIGSGGRFRGKIGDGKIVSATEYLPVAGDESTDVARDAFALVTAEYPAARHIWWGGNHYANSAGLPDASCWLVWDKENGSNDFADAELAWTNHPGAVRLFRHMWNGMLRASERGPRVHPTQKPVALAAWAMGVVDPDSTRKIVLDIFAGSGSTLMAAHETGRVAVLIEMEPGYVDIICRRFQEYTGTKPILASTGQPHDFTAPPQQ
jgi:site-specific DNA-methyltransferase (adenine-specific)/modification methylase